MIHPQYTTHFYGLVVGATKKLTGKFLAFYPPLLFIFFLLPNLKHTHKILDFVHLYINRFADFSEVLFRLYAIPILLFRREDERQMKKVDKSSK